MKVTPEMVEHAEYCLPRPGATEPRMEGYSATRYGANGITVAGSSVVHRCIECGNRTVDGRLVRD